MTRVSLLVQTFVSNLGVHFLTPRKTHTGGCFKTSLRCMPDLCQGTDEFLGQLGQFASRLPCHTVHTCRVAWFGEPPRCLKLRWGSSASWQDLASWNSFSRSFFKLQQRLFEYVGITVESLKLLLSSAFQLPFDKRHRFSKFFQGALWGLCCNAMSAAAASFWMVFPQLWLRHVNVCLKHPKTAKNEDFYELDDLIWFWYDFEWFYWLCNPVAVKFYDILWHFHTVSHVLPSSNKFLIGFT